jgi:hypothetical protein
VLAAVLVGMWAKASISPLAPRGSPSP